MGEEGFVDFQKGFFIVYKEVKQVAFVLLGEVDNFYSVFSELSQPQ